MSSNVSNFTERRHKDSPDYELEVWVTGVREPGGQVHWKIHIEGEDDSHKAANILDRVIEVLRDDSIPNTFSESGE